MKIKCIPEGREDVWIPDSDSIIRYIRESESESFHCFIPVGSMMFGADWLKQSVINLIDKAERLGIILGGQNLGHDLSVIAENKLHCFKIGIKIDNIETE